MDITKNGNKSKYVESILKLKNDLKYEELSRQVTELQEELEKNRLETQRLEKKLQMDQKVGIFFYII
jgi:hydrogenase maturation factor